MERHGAKDVSLGVGKLNCPPICISLGHFGTRGGAKFPFLLLLVYGSTLIVMLQIICAKNSKELSRIRPSAVMRHRSNELD